MTLDFYYVPGSGPCRSVLMVAKALGLDLNKKLTVLKNGEHLKPEFVKINPQHCVPTLVDNGFSLCESRAIITYLVDKYGKDDSLYPKDAQKRALILHRLFFDATVLYQRFGDLYYPYIFAGVPFDDEKKKKLDEAFDFLNTFLIDNEFAAGNSLTVADISLMASISSMEVCEYDFSKFPNVVRWYNKAKSTIPDYEESNKGVEEFRQMYLAAKK